MLRTWTLDEYGVRSHTRGELYLPAEQLSKIVGCSAGLIHLWWKDGIVSRKPFPKITKHSPRWVYNYDQVVERGRTRRKLKPMKIGMRDGVKVYRCAVCEKFKPRDCFYEDKRNKLTGILSRCVECYKLYHKENYDPKDPRYVKKVQQSVAIQKQATANARAASAWKYPAEIDAIIVAWFVRRKYPDHNAAQLSHICSFPERQIRAMFEYAQTGRRVKLATATEILIGLDLGDDLDALHRGMERNRPRWHHRYDYCQLCFRTTVRHIARGLCGTCYDHRDDPTYIPVPENRWSITEPRCVVCKSTKYRHQAFGKCTSCYRKEWRAKRRSRVGSGHGNDGQVQEAAEQATDHQLGGRCDLGRVASHAGCDHAAGRELAAPHSRLR